MEMESKPRHPHTAGSEAGRRLLGSPHDPPMSTAESTHLVCRRLVTYLVTRPSWKALKPSPSLVLARSVARLTTGSGRVSGGERRVPNRGQARRELVWVDRMQAIMHEARSDAAPAGI